jgi:hypothetical protein
MAHRDWIAAEVLAVDVTTGAVPDVEIAKA